jgi:nucleotide-binding universal stress UspA family protein
MKAAAKVSNSRILLAFDSASDNRNALRTAVRLAAGLQAELRGMFLEDTDLLGIAGLPFAEEILHWSARERSLGAGELERSLKALAARVRQELAQAALEANVRWSFQVERGPRLQLLLETGGRYDLLLVGERRRSAAGLGTPDRARRQPTVYLVFTGSKAGKRALRAGAALLKTHGAQLTVFVAGPDRAATKELHAEAIRRLEKAGLIARLVDCPADVAGESLSERLAGLCGIALILPLGSELPQKPERFQQLLESVNCPLMLVR